jgi:hypothetical protein
MEKVDTISEIQTKELPARDGKPPLTLYLMKDSEGREYSTRDRSLAQTALAAYQSGAHVHLEFDEQSAGQYGQFTRRYLSSLHQVDEQLGPVGQAVRQAQAIATGTSGAVSTDPFEDAIPDPPRRDREAEKDLSIAKAVGLKAGVEVMQYLPETERTVSNVTVAAEYFTQWLVSWKPKP